MKKVLLVCAMVLIFGAIFAQEDGIKGLKKEIQELKKKVSENEKKIEATADSIEDSGVKSGVAFGNTTLGGYGELHMNQLSGKEDGTSSKREIDFHRFVLFVEHKFTDRIKLYSEFEIEHVIASKSDAGEVEIEQAFIDFEYINDHHVWGGLFLIPVGFLNETHEPPTFYGVERNPVEKNILPSTWWEAGAMFKGQITEELSYDFGIHSGLNVGSGDSYKIRSGRQKVSKASARAFASTGRITYRPMAGFDLSLALHFQQDLTQKTEVESVSAFMFNLNVSYQHKGFGIKALYAHWILDGDGPDAIGADTQSGFYLEPSYRINDNWGVFARYAMYNNAAGSNGGDSEKSQFNIGVNYWPHEKIVVKLDFEDQFYENDSGERRGINLGIGYQF
ncbi:MAG: porin [Planctomycetota bacterium]|nr:MAG: porin [Planctomycetota bacterium]